VVLLASGGGSLAEALMSAAERESYPARVVGLVSDKPAAGVLEKASKFGVTTSIVDFNGYPTRREWSQALCAATLRFDPAWVISAGFGKILSPEFLRCFPKRVLNTHPSLLPNFPGANAVADALAAGVRVTGASIHVVGEGVDIGPVIAQREVPVEPGDDVIRLHERIKSVERAMLVETIAKLAEGRFDEIDDRIVLR
jgi:phosphoribosylglycinamide formyltransferase-1